MHEVGEGLAVHQVDLDAAGEVVQRGRLGQGLLGERSAQ
jgi:hypothetical protein